jgi:hypothetical protein
MRVLERLSDYSDAQLNQLEQNALKLQTGPKADDANQVLMAIVEERDRRKVNNQIKTAEAAARVNEKVANLSFAKRVEAAFSDVPPLDWERAALAALAEHPGATTEELSRALGYDGTYMNWFGMVCRDREPWLGPAMPGPDGKTVYSDLLVNFATNSGEETSTASKRWWLKPEALSTLRNMGIIK